MKQPTCCNEWGCPHNEDGKCYVNQDDADFVEVKHGEWLKISLGSHDYVDRYKCSLCENIVLPYPNNIDSYLYCPKCGAKMNLKVGEK